jgi:hypothetical protein
VARKTGGKGGEEILAGAAEALAWLEGNKTRARICEVREIIKEEGKEKDDPSPLPSGRGTNA